MLGHLSDGEFKGSYEAMCAARLLATLTAPAASGEKGTP